MKSLGGTIQGQLAPIDDEERERALAAGHNLDPDFVLATDDLVSSEDCFFVATGITDGELMKGVHFRPHGAVSHSLVMRSRSGTIRSITAEHRFEKLREFAEIDYER
jgi:fructose-1,6-bisphosphatase II